ncbi:glycoside hydrolase/deacetylase [Wallemia mellicola]|nr:glycoside hydrolase/deacetylase [Wallemia mellicola]
MFLRTGLFSLSLLGLSRSQNVPPTDAESAALIQDPIEECTSYNVPMVDEIKPNFPPIWEPAVIVEGDTAAQNKFNEIKQVLPSNIKPKGTHDGDFSKTLPSYDVSDPDCWYTFNKCTKPKVEGLSDDITNLPEPETWGLGFDDGPNCSHNKFYDFLSENELKANMYYIGSNVLNWPYQAQRGRSDGHQLCVHSWSHHHMTSFDDEGAFAELYYTIQAIKAVTGVTPTCWRPPFGDVDDRIRLIAESLGLETTLWEYDTKDWQTNFSQLDIDTVRQNYEDVFDAAKNGTFNDHGTIVLTHEITGNTMDLFMEMYPKIKENFKYVVPFYAATNTTNLYVETDEEVEQGETFEDYVNHVYGSTVSAPTSTNTNYHPEPTKTGWGGPLATVANPTVVSIESASESGSDEDDNVVNGQNDSDINRVSIEHKDSPNGKGDSSDNSKATHTSVTSLTAIVALFVISTSFTF